MSAMSECSAERQQEEEVQRDIEQVVELACMGRQLTETQQALLRWATGTQKPEQPLDYPLPQMPLGWGGED